VRSVKGVLSSAANFHMTSEDAPPKKFSARRWLTVLLRSAHIVAAAIVLGGVFFSKRHDEIYIAIWAAIISGSLLLFVDVFKSPRVLLQGSGLFALLKLAFLGTGFFLLPNHRFYWYMGATVIASVGSHMPSGVRHFDLLERLKKRQGQNA